MKWLWWIVAVKGVVLGALIASGYIGLAPDEAQYWTWSQDLDWGYYSKPPAIAWQIWLTTKLLGNTVLGVRLGALLMGALLSFAVWGVARGVGLEKKTALWGAVIMALSPIGFYLSLVATTDGGAILFLTLAVVCVARGKEGPKYLLAGLCILAGALFKWTAFLFWPIALPFLLLNPKSRSWTILGGIAISLLGLLPSLYWNAGHEWATFRHVGTAVAARSGGNFFDFLGAQVGLLSPIFFALLVISYYFLRKRQELWITAAFPAVVLIYLVLAVFKKIQPNWAAFLYPPGIMLAAWVACERLKRGKMWLWIGSGVSLAMVTALFVIPWIQTSGSTLIPYKLNPFRQSMGWEHLPEALAEAGYNPQEDFLFADKYQNVSLLSFYSQEQKRAYYFNISETRKTQFSYWPQMQEQEVGKTGFFVVLENMKESDSSWYVDHYIERLNPYFEIVAYKGAYPLFSIGGEGVKYALVFEGFNYLGGAPQDPDKF